MVPEIIEQISCDLHTQSNDQINNSNDSKLIDEIHLKAQRIKEDANKLFQEKKYIDAIKMYTEAINLVPTDPIYYANRSLAYFQIKSYENAIVDATKSLELDSSFIKGYFRRASALIELDDMPNAIKDLDIIHNKMPNDLDVQKKLKFCRDRLVAERYRLALRNTKVSSIWETLSAYIKPNDDPSTIGPQIDFHQLSQETINDVIGHFKKQKMIHHYYVAQLMMLCHKRFKEMPNIIQIAKPEQKKRNVTICGDIHGQFFDLLNIFEINGVPSQENVYIFNGDLVDRGQFSCEVIILLLLFNQLNPNSLFINRGNHENHSMNYLYGFEAEIKNKFKSYVCDDIYLGFRTLFESLPLCSIVGEQIFICHGGVPQQGNVELQDIDKIYRFEQIPDDGIFCDLLWADPHPSTGTLPNGRGISYKFGSDITQQFLDKNNLSCIIRSHEMEQEGYRIQHDGKCITIFSAPNYCNIYNNKGAFISVKDDLTMDFKQFSSVSQPSPAALGLS